MRQASPLTAIRPAPRLPLWVGLVLVLGCLGVALPARAEKVIWHYDDLPADMNQLASGLANHPKYVHPGFVQNEAFGQLYKPKAADYPVKILSVELVMAQAPTISAIQTLPAVIEIWNDDSVAAAPTSAAPVWTISTQDFFNPGTGQPGMPIQGNTGMIYEFDWSKPENHPPLITKGNIRVVIRISSGSKDLSTMWNKLECSKTDLGIGIDLCGCQNVAAITDLVTTPGVNLMHIVTPLGTCSGNKEWKFVEQISSGSSSMKGDFLLRMGVDGIAPTPAPDAGGDSSAPDAGSGDVPPPPDVQVQKPVIDLVTPASGATDKVVKIDIVGQHFQAGATVKVGSTAISVDQVSATSISATVLPGIAPGVYAVVVSNPNGSIGFKDAAFTVTAAPAPDAGSTDTAGADAGSGAPLEAPIIELVTPSGGPTDQVVAFEIIGKHFQNGATVKIGATAVAIDKVTPTTISARVVPGMAPGVYAVVVSNPTGQVGFKEGAYTVTAATLAQDAAGGSDVAAGSDNGARDDGCTAGPDGRQAPVAAWLFALTGLVWWRRRAAAVG